MSDPAMTPKLAELIAHCKANGIKGSYGVSEDPPGWQARVRVGQTIHSGGAATADEALERMAGVALTSLLDPMPQPGSDEFSAWQARRKG